MRHGTVLMFLSEVLLNAVSTVDLHDEGAGSSLVSVHFIL